MSEFMDYLAHHGIKGQKKGIRRYQNEDGSYTELGKIHYGIGDGNRDKKGEKKGPEYTSDVKKYKSSEASHLSDEELARRTKRINDELNYRTAVQRMKDADTSPRKKLMKKIFVDSMSNAASEVVKNVYTTAAKKFIEGIPALSSGSGKKKS